MDIIVKVKEVKGSCPTFKVGDSFALKAGYQLVSDSPVCMHALSSIMPFHNAHDRLTAMRIRPGRQNRQRQSIRSMPRSGRLHRGRYGYF